MLENFQKQNLEHFCKLNERLDSLSENVKNEIHKEFQPKIEDLKTGQRNLQETVERQQSFIEQLDVAHRADKLIITGISETENIVQDGFPIAFNDFDKCKALLTMLDSDAEIKEITRRGKDDSRPKPIKLTLVKLLTEMTFWKNPKFCTQNHYHSGISRLKEILTLLLERSGLVCLIVTRMNKVTPTTLDVNYESTIKGERLPETALLSTVLKILFTRF